MILMSEFYDTNNNFEGSEGYLKTVFEFLEQGIDNNEGFDYAEEVKEKFYKVKGLNKEEYEFSHFQNLTFELQDEIFNYFSFFTKLSRGQYIYKGKKESDKITLCHIDLINDKLYKKKVSSPNEFLHSFDYQNLFPKQEFLNVYYEQRPKANVNKNIKDIINYIPIIPNFDEFLKDYINEILKDIKYKKDHIISMMLIKSKGIIEEVKPITKKVMDLALECKVCSELTYMSANPPKNIEKFYNDDYNTVNKYKDFINIKDTCEHCGSTNFNEDESLFEIIPNKSKTINHQQIEIKSLDDKQKIIAVLEDDQCNKDLKKGDSIQFQGQLKSNFFKDSEIILSGFIYIDIFEYETENNQINSQNEIDRKSPNYTHWKNNVLNKGGNKCICCGETAKPEAHHIYSFNKYPDLRFDINNGIVLCHWCHNKYHTLYDKNEANPISLIKFLLTENKK